MEPAITHTARLNVSAPKERRKMVQGGWSVWKGTFFRGSEIWDGSRRRVRIFKGRDEGKDLARKGNCVNRSLNVGGCSTGIGRCIRLAKLERHLEK